MIREQLRMTLRVLLSKYVMRALGVLIFCGILWMIDLRKVWFILRNAQPMEVTIGFLMLFPVSYARAFRWNLIKRRLGIRIPYSQSFAYQLIAQMAFFTPGKVGEFIKAVYLKGEDYSLTKGGISIVGDRIFDILTMTLVGSAAFVYFFRDIVISNPTTLILILIGGPVALGLLVNNRRRLFFLFRTGVMFFVPDAFQERIGRFFDDLENHLSDYSALWIGCLFLISFAAFAFQVLRIYLFALAIGISISYLQLAGIIALMSLSNLLPITFLGLGTRDAVFLYFFGLLGVAPEKAIGLSIIVFSFIVLAGGLAAFLFVITPPKIQVSSVFEIDD